MLFICDPQIDLIKSDTFRSAIPIEGSEEAMKKIVGVIDRVGFSGNDPLSTITVMREFNRTIDINNPNFWVNAQGKNPLPYTIVYHDDVKSGRWIPRDQGVKLRELSDKTIMDHCLAYTHTVETKHKCPLIIWPENCIDGTRGHNIYPELMGALMQWEREEFAAVNFINKTSSNFVEMHGPLYAEFRLKEDESTRYNQNGLALVNEIKKADVVGFCGNSLSLSVRVTISQLMRVLTKETKGQYDFSKFHILMDCCSVMGALHEVDFPAITATWLDEVQSKGVKLIDSSEFLTPITRSGRNQISTNVSKKTL